MSVIDELHINDEGTELRFQVNDQETPMDVSSATEMLLIMEKPDKTTVVQTLAFITDGNDGLVKYTTTSTDLDQVGHWKFQLKLTFANGVWRSNIIRQYVYGNLVEPSV